MKKTFLLFICFIVGMNYSFAQKSAFGITAGATLASYKINIESVSLTSDSRIGFTFGILSSIPLAKSFSFQPALNFTQKGGKLASDYGNDEMTLNYLEVPLNFLYNTSSTGARFFVGAGPSLSVGLSGKEKWEDDTGSGSEDIKFGNGEDADLKGFELGANFLAGYQFANGLFLAANYNAGLSNVAPDDPNYDSKDHNRYFGLRIGYMFGGKPKAAPQQN